MKEEIDGWGEGNWGKVYFLSRVKET